MGQIEVGNGSTWPLEDVFILHFIIWIQQGGSILLVTLLNDICYGLTILGIMGGLSTENLLST